MNKNGKNGAVINVIDHTCGSLALTSQNDS